MLLLVAALVLGLLAYLYVSTRPPPPLQCGFDLNDQSLLVPGKERIRRSRLQAKCPKGEFIRTLHKDVKTLYDAFQRGAKISGKSNCLGYRTQDGQGPFEWMTYDEVVRRFTNFGSGLLEMGIEPGQKSFIGVYSKNRPEWVITEQAVSAYSMALVPLYDTLGPNAVEFIVNQAQIPCVVCDSPKLPLLKASAGKCKSLRLVVVMDGEIDEGDRKDFADMNIVLESMDAVERRGAANLRDHIPPKPEYITTVCYTSGTTGDPKGAMLTHANFIADHAGCAFCFMQSSISDVTKDDVLISYLPLAHIFESLMELWMFINGASVGYFNGDVKRLIADIGVLRPTVFPSVPRLLNKLYDKVLAQIPPSGIKRKLFDAALAAKTREVRAGIFRRNSIWDKLVFKKVQARLGGRVRIMATGAAPISDACLTFLRAAFGVPVLEGYGQTECTAAGTMSAIGDGSTGMVGVPLPVGEVKLADVLEMGYEAKNDVGEICFRGPHVMKGYLNNPEKTAETIDKDGWLHSGDIGRWLPNGTLKIFDRKKSIFKLSQGEYIAPEKVANIFIQAPMIAQAFVYGHSLHHLLVAVLVPDTDPGVFSGWVRANVPGVDADAPLEELCKNQQVVDACVKCVNEVGQKGGLKRFELIAGAVLEPDPFSVENGLLTPSFKQKRPILTKKYQKQIDALYAEIDAKKK